ncbi:hypothetical protein B9Z55_005659 [Caenorhabditis nigoni]|uniref:C-type lectin domain-containing protein n=2 Tax=Caenorhabditis nigoni TaxID=1611254 RepID=A0A2G5V1X4_9PELO|nr:hypothetical protein B9Z55_005659 [Caenorhabditis nigoni]
MYISVMFVGLFGMFLFAESADPITYLDRHCGADLSKLWLDVIFVVDNSRAVTCMDRVRKSILKIFNNGTIIGTSEDNPRTTRISLVTYNKYAEIIADLNQFESFDDFNKSISINLANSSTLDESYLIKGLESATVVLEKSSLAGERLNYKKVIVIYASLGDDILLAIPLADRLKADGITIIAVAETSGTDTGKLDFWLDLISSGSMSFTIQDEKLVQEIQDSFLQTNCFCPNGWVQLRTSFSDMHSYRYGICLSLSPLTAIWRAARLSCRNQWRNGYLVNEYEANKHNYVLESLRNSSLFRSPYTYYIGLTYSTGSWYWDQPEGSSLRKVDNQQWKNWNPGYPIPSSTQTIGVNVQNVTDESETGWQNENAMGEAHYYVCEVASCDTDNYCETENN